MKSHEEYMREAILLSAQSIEEGGGPFAALIVDSKTGEVIGRGKNRVTLHSDPTAHGEVEAIRDAGKNTGMHEFAHGVLYTSSEPCPGCLLETVFNAGITEIYFGNGIEDAAAIGFADDHNWHILDTTARDIIQRAGGTMTQLLRDEALEVFKAWHTKPDKVEYYRAT